MTYKNRKKTCFTFQLSLDYKITPLGYMAFWKRILHMFHICILHMFPIDIFCTWTQCNI